MALVMLIQTQPCRLTQSCSIGDIAGSVRQVAGENRLLAGRLAGDCLRPQDIVFLDVNPFISSGGWRTLLNFGDGAGCPAWYSIERRFVVQEGKRNGETYGVTFK